ncbi:UbiD family decarboxylase [Klebsiella pneumoniae]|uniref:UbiD family decarboxylase n=1 Tax=Klebsiella pneumoniae TaxID=573 RepID=UPI00058AD04A|nr:UbiD family decarboxylase [Klebsiella pneumoniae]EKW0008592.1 UbiD family decarboxylase [Klebsiella pneumoniae]EKZ5940594.1 UbiD family decarboxylase [Klebsiella pneumoniae]ELA0823289.1 UbiD family decarboxylase [Klebsiella pneumoniae]MBC4459288.1 UbiD family decarboxylase [Klebsiella pneumoniae]MBC4774866.1 UbiD family decarboxylase [Klebsiella pneumoniae]
MTAPIQDLRDAIALLQQHDNQYLETDHPVDPNAELAGVYRHIGAGGTVKRPTRIGPAMMFNNIKGYPHSRILVGMHASRQRAALLLGCEASQLALEVGKAVKKPVAPVVVPASSAPCQEQIFLADDPDFDLRTLLPAPTNTPIDAGPFFCLGLALASDPDDASLTDVTIHRLCVQGRNELSMFLAAGRHIEVFRQKAEAAGKPLPITINMGLDPAIYIGACFEAPTTPFGYNELGVAGALRQRPVELVQGVSVPEKAIARAEIVIEGELLPGVRVREDQHTNSGHAMPEFPGYCGGANPSLPVIKVKAVTMRNNAILQTLVGPGEEHTTLAGLPTEASIWNAVEAAIPGFLQNVYAHTAGGGKFLGILQVKKRQPADEGRQGQAALLALATYSELKNIILVDEDVDIFDSDDILWAMTTRMQGDVSITTIPGIRGHQLDPSQTPEYSPSIRGNGISCKTIFDCTVPWALKSHFERAPFADVDPRPFAPEYFARLEKNQGSAK